MNTHERKSNEMRALAITQSLLSKADGSAKFSFGDVSVLASVTGPMEVRLREEQVDKATLEINVRPLRSLASLVSKAQEDTLRSLLSPVIMLNLHPRSLIQVTVQTLSLPSTMYGSAYSTDSSSLDSSTTEDDSLKVRNISGSGAAERAAQVNAAMLALMDAGVECKGVVLAVAIAFVKGEMILDPSPMQEDQAESNHVFSFSFGVGVGGTAGQCVGMQSLGDFSEDELFDAEDLAQKSAQAILAFVRRSIESRYGAIANERTATTRSKREQRKPKKENEEETLMDLQ